MKDGINEMTNADKIRSMSDEELEKFIKHIKETCLKMHYILSKEIVTVSLVQNVGKNINRCMSG